MISTLGSFVCLPLDLRLYVGRTRGDGLLRDSANGCIDWKLFLRSVGHQPPGLVAI